MCTTDSNKTIIKYIEELCRGFFVPSSVKGAPITIRTAKGVDYTYKIQTKEFKGKMYTHVWIEFGYLEFRYLGCFNTYNGKIYRKKTEVQGQSAALISWVLFNAKAQRFELINRNVEFMHLGQCFRCGRALSDAVSIEYGMGSTCRGKK